MFFTYCGGEVVTLYRYCSVAVNAVSKPTKWPAVYVIVSLQGKEFETRLKEKKPGDLSDELRIALGMPVGPVRSTNVIFPLQSKTTPIKPRLL